MSALHGPVSIETMGDLRRQVEYMSDIPDETPVLFSMIDDEFAHLNRFSNTMEADGLILDAADAGDGVKPIVFAPWTTLGNKRT